MLSNAKLLDVDFEINELTRIKLLRESKLLPIFEAVNGSLLEFYNSYDDSGFMVHYKGREYMVDSVRVKVKVFDLKSDIVPVTRMGCYAKRISIEEGTLFIS